MAWKANDQSSDTQRSIYAMDVFREIQPPSNGSDASLFKQSISGLGLFAPLAC
jgi:hypothetical protein